MDDYNYIKIDSPDLGENVTLYVPSGEIQYLRFDEDTGRINNISTHNITIYRYWGNTNWTDTIDVYAMGVAHYRKQDPWNNWQTLQLNVNDATFHYSSTDFGQRVQPFAILVLLVVFMLYVTYNLFNGRR